MSLLLLLLGARLSGPPIAVVFSRVRGRYVDRVRVSGRFTAIDRLDGLFVTRVRVRGREN